MNAYFLLLWFLFFRLNYLARCFVYLHAIFCSTSDCLVLYGNYRSTFYASSHIFWIYLIILNTKCIMEVLASISIVWKKKAYLLQQWYWWWHWRNRRPIMFVFTFFFIIRLSEIKQTWICFHRIHADLAITCINI